MAATDIDLPPAKGLRGFLRAAAQVDRLVDHDPGTTAFMRHRAELRPGPTEGPSAGWVPLDRMSPYLVCAVIGAEDPLFFQHHGVWWNQVKIVLLRALIMKEPMRAVSTITQQLARNLYLTPTRSLSRKVAEALLTWRLEAALTKRRILELYLNVAEWGDGLWGIGAAAKRHCGCTPDMLDAFQSVVLVSLLPAPTRPLSGWNARRALAVQHRLPRFLYSAGLLNIAEERLVQERIAALTQALPESASLADAMRRAGSGGLRAGGTRAMPSVDTLVAEQCGWTHRLRFEQFLREVGTGRASLVARPMWWTEAAPSRSSDGRGISG